MCRPTWALWPHLTGGEVLELLAHLGPPPDWASSTFTPVPYDRVNWFGATGMTLIAASLAALGLVSFQRRDIRG